MFSVRKLLPFVGAVFLGGCSTNVQDSHPPTISLNHPLPVAKPVSGDVRQWAKAQFIAEWPFPLPLSHGFQPAQDASNCEELLTLVDDGFEARNPFEYPAVHSRHTLCQAVQASTELDFFAISYLGENLLHEHLPYEAPAEFSLTAFRQQPENAAARLWHEVDAPAGFEQNSDDESLYTGGSGSVQRLRVLARGDYNGDKIEDALVHLENGAKEGHAYASRLLIVTRRSEEMPLMVLATAGSVIR